MTKSELQAAQGQQHESDVGTSGEEADEDMGDGEQQAEGQFGGEEMTQQQAAGDDESRRDEAGKGTELSEAPTEAPGAKDAEDSKDASDRGNEMTADKESTGEQPTEDKSAESGAGQPDDQGQKSTQQADDKYAKVEEPEGGMPPEDDTPDDRRGTGTESPVDEGMSSQAVERFDQLSGGMNLTDEQTTQEGGLPDQEGTATASLGGVLMDQWLERIEGDPAFLLRNQFMLEEKRALEQTGRELIETRPW